MSAAAAEGELQRTALFDLHTELGGKMVPFAGYALPVQYKNLGILASHKHTRAEGCSSLFDVSHMGQIHWSGADAASFLESVVVGDIAALEAGSGTLSLMTNDDGGIIDDTVITYLGDGVYNMVVNGACKVTDYAHLEAKMADFDGEVVMDVLADQQLLALQGPGAAAALSSLVPEDLSKMGFMTAKSMTVQGVGECMVFRCGYTGEDGFEISVTPDKATQLARALLAAEGVQPAGLGARDSLRLEAGLCLYGNDIDGTTTPVEANLSWTIGKRRRQDRRFPGADKIVGQLKEKNWPRRRVGFVVDGVPARAGTKVFSADGQTELGVVTSGTMAPSMGKPISMGYVQKGFHKNGTEVAVQVRGKMVKATVAKMPFVPAHYFRADA